MANGKTAVIYTLGCRVNQYESDAIAEELEKDGIRVVSFGQTADVCIVNTCTVTAESDRKSRQIIRRMAATYPGVPVIAAGCFAEVSSREALRIPGVAAVCGNSAKGDVARVARELIDGTFRGGKNLVTDIQSAPYDGLTLSLPRRCRSYIKIEDGCENRCAYCLIPTARGRIRSKAADVILREVCDVARGGCEEVILTGIETASYGKDTGDTLASLLREVAAVPGIRRIGLGSLEPNLMRGAFLREVASLPSLLPHFHLSIQSGSSGVLRRMRRPYNAEQAMDAIRKAREAIPGVGLTADVIVGFPGETEEEFEETVAFCREARFLHLHIFPFSQREGTEADTMPDQVPGDVRHSRAARLEAVQKEVKAALLDEYVAAHRTEPVYVLCEEPVDGMVYGHSEHYVDVLCDAAPGDMLRIIPVYLTGHDGVNCTGTVKGGTV